MPGLEIYWEAFWELQSDRPISMGGTPPIPFTSICKYAEAFGFVGEEFDELNFFVRQMDNEFLDFRKKSSDMKPTNNTVTF